ncbi:MAG: SDR family oxidoreductase [Dehalococcoidia bacterium]|nr:SDR family oxidoreductase [Dehalococcoidia bacterium]
MDLGLAEKTVMVTGGGSSIGRAISLAFARERVNLVIIDLDTDQGEKTVAEARRQGAQEAMAVKGDVTDIAKVEGAVKTVLDKFGRIDVLVNNVGVDYPMLFVDSTPEIWDKLIAINYRSVLNCTRAVLGPMIAQKNGSIINIGSEAGRLGEYKEAVYAGMKGGVIAFTKAVARENGPKGIRLNVVCPALTIPERDEIGEMSVWQKSIDMFPPGSMEKIIKLYPLRRLGKPQDIANAVIFLASDAAGYITGQTLSVNGGCSMM